MELRGRYRPLEGGPGSTTPTRFGGHTTMMWMVTRAYGVKTRQVSGPSWMETEYFEIAATLAPGATKEQERIMWQNLLKERFPPGGAPGNPRTADVRVGGREK